VRPKYDLGSDDSVRFWLNVVADTAAAITATYAFDNIATEADADFWTIYILGAYQYVEAEDRDPVENTTYGVVDGINGAGASVYTEAIADRVDHDPAQEHPSLTCRRPAVLAHEVGHLFNGLHEHGDLMAGGCGFEMLAFSADTLAAIRSVAHP
jgi:hypothetical protein